jgi:hypothetical protein
MLKIIEPASRRETSEHCLRNEQRWQNTGRQHCGLIDSTSVSRLNCVTSDMQGQPAHWSDCDVRTQHLLPWWRADLRCPAIVSEWQTSFLLRSTFGMWRNVGTSWLMFRRNVLPPFSRSKSKPSKQERQVEHLSFLVTSCLIGHRRFGGIYCLHLKK